jgi:hypothetical protein
MKPNTISKTLNNEPVSEELEEKIEKEWEAKCKHDWCFSAKNKGYKYCNFCGEKEFLPTQTWEREFREEYGFLTADDFAPETKVITLDQAVSFISSQKEKWEVAERERMVKEIKGLKKTEIKWAGTDDHEKNVLLATFDIHNRAISEVINLINSSN